MRVHLHDLLEEQAEHRPTASALTAGEQTRDYAELAAVVREAAAGMRRLGIVPGDRVAVLLDKRLETVEAIFAASYAGAVFVPVNPLLKPEQIAHVLADCDVRLLVTSTSRWGALGDAAHRLPALERVVLVEGAAAGTGDAGVPVCSWDALLASGREAGPAAARAHAGVDSDLAAILYTSGSTGRPKGVVLSHRNLVVGAESVSGYLDNRPDDVILAALPLSFDAGLSQVTTAFAVGAHVVLVNYLLPRDVVRLCARHGVTGLTCVPPLWIQLAGVEWPPEATGLRYFANTGGRMPRATLTRLRELFPQARPFLMYGLTEAFRSTYLDPAEVDRRPDSIGRAVPDAEVLVLRPDGTPAAPGEEGELVHRGPLVAQGYWNDPARTAERFRPVPDPHAAWRAPERAVWSGDAVVADEEGYLYFVGRSDDMIKTSGYRVSPSEVEEVAHDTGLVGEVAALGVEDDRLGQRIVLVLSPPVGTPDPTAYDAAALLAELRRRLPLFMVPAEVRVLDELPRSPNGKFDRVLLRKEVS
ncbi:acyl-CoA ligase (AMP-forming), exosortase A system-associated [Nocardioides sp. dk4132]|uniref:acyl-CoA ligase (AMP-forming), exosortase A system-associated n=1 Tax=unclassified Nocardioides TaxID=2615069 RepID=UPI00129517C6|nr:MULTISPECIES: acyl-CoA ligase (AMP-forming), exosortase A system-associated [unclassified Nocardioides]MQW74792.1 acyl-CoA ligase (AMP-forming), exosortase A system-associated [Nocardioides sp. dk4132]QGA06684.1 acyl-CoA ligase (AMP-forming), exosortase A system-associated [Nocardioides sp. dk884]